MANIIGTKWGSSELGTAGGTVTWSIAAAGTDISRFGVETQTSVSGDSFLSYDFEQVIADAFAEWSKYGDIEFEQVADQGGDAGVGTDADIRIYFGAIPGGTAGYAFYPSSWGSAIAGDILLDTIAAFENDPELFFNLVLHEIGHALGLGHVSENSIMTPTVRKIGLQEDDIAGIQEIYGVQDDAPAHDEGCDCPSCCSENDGSNTDGSNTDGSNTDGSNTDGSNTDGSNTDGSNTDGSHDGHNHEEIGHDHDHDDPNHTHGEDDQAPTAEIISGGNGNDRLIGTADAEVINGEGGNDTIRGGAGDDTINGGDGADRIHGGVGNDTVSGQDGNDVLKGHSGNDYLNGGAGRDKIRGGDGEDTINGGSENDRLFGVEGNDIFEFSDGHGHDLIRDYNARGESDLIDLSGVAGINNFGDVLAAASMKKSHVVIATGEDSSIMLYRTDLSELEASDFLF